MVKWALDLASKTNLKPSLVLIHLVKNETEKSWNLIPIVRDVLELRKKFIVCEFSRVK